MDIKDFAISGSVAVIALGAVSDDGSSTISSRLIKMNGDVLEESFSEPTLPVGIYRSAEKVREFFGIGKDSRENRYLVRNPEIIDILNEGIEHITEVFGAGDQAGGLTVVMEPEDETERLSVALTHHDLEGLAFKEQYRKNDKGVSELGKIWWYRPDVSSRRGAELLSIGPRCG